MGVEWVHGDMVRVIFRRSESRVGGDMVRVLCGWSKGRVGEDNVRVLCGWSASKVGWDRVGYFVNGIKVELLREYYVGGVRVK